MSALDRVEVSLQATSLRPTVLAEAAAHRAATAETPYAYCEKYLGTNQDKGLIVYHPQFTTNTCPAGYIRRGFVTNATRFQVERSMGSTLRTYHGGDRQENLRILGAGATTATAVGIIPATVFMVAGFEGGIVTGFLIGLGAIAGIALVGAAVAGACILIRTSMSPEVLEAMETKLDKFWRAGGGVGFEGTGI